MWACFVYLLLHLPSLNAYSVSVTCNLHANPDVYIYIKIRDTIHWHYLRQRSLPGAACGVFHAPSSLLPPSLSVRLSPCRSCLLSFSDLENKSHRSGLMQDEASSSLTHTHAAQKIRGQLNSLTATTNQQMTGLTAHR